MKLKFIKTRGTYAAGSVYELPTNEAVKAIDAGDAMPEAQALAIEASTKAQTDSATAVKAATMKRLDDAITRAKGRMAIAPQDDTVRAKYEASVLVDADAVVQIIEGMAQIESLVQASQRQTKPLNDNGNPAGIQVIGMDPKDAACQYVKARSNMDTLIKTNAGGKFKQAFELARESGLLLSNYVLPVLAKGQDYMLRDLVRASGDTTDTNLGTIASSLVLMRNLGFVKAMLNWLPYITTDLRNEPALYNQYVNTRYIVPQAVLNFKAGVGMVSDNGHTTPDVATATTVDATVRMTSFQGVPISFGTDLLGSTARALFAEQRDAQFYSLGLAISQALRDTIFAATWAPKSVADGTTALATTFPVDMASFNWPVLVDMQNQLLAAGVPMVSQFAMLHQAYYNQLIKDNNLMLVNTITTALGKTDAIYQTGELPALLGIKPLRSQVFANTAYSTTGWTPTKVGFIGGPASMLFCARIPQDYLQVAKAMGVPDTAGVEIVTDPESGLTILVTKFTNHSAMQVQCTAMLMYGFGQGHPGQGIVVVPKTGGAQD